MVNRDRITTQTSGIVGNNGTLGGETIVSGIYDKASFSAGWNTFRTDGWRDNAQQRDNLGNAFVQYEISPNTSIQAEYRYRKNTRGDTGLRFFEDDFIHGLTNSFKTNTYRLGLRHNLAPNSTILASGMYQERDSAGSIRGPAPLNLFELQLPQKGVSGELQHLYVSRYLNTTAGVGHFNIQGVNSLFVDLQGFGQFPSQSGNDFTHTNVYGYANIKPLSSLTITLGLSTDFVKSDDPAGGNTNQVNPKFGLIWEPLPGTIIRAAAFRTLKRSLITNQTIEPTQVSGFNQFYDDINSTSAWRYAVALNQKVNKNVYVGGEYSYRDMKSPFTDLSNPSVPVAVNEAQSEYQGRGYAFWTPHDWISLRAELIWDLYKTAAGIISDQPTTLTTHRVPLGINFFHPSGLSAFATATYWNQEGTFRRLNGNVESGSNNFWIADVGLSYRLPDRYGLLTVGALNLFDKSFHYFDRDFTNPIIQPDRLVFAKLTLALP